MNDDYVHPWDQPEAEGTHRTVQTTLHQTLTGLPVGLATLDVICSACKRAIQEGDHLWVYAYRAADDPEWLLTRCYCEACAVDEIETPTLGTSETLVEARLDVVAITSEQRHHLCLGAVDVRAFSPLTEGARP
ncbi:hypothetical protein [Halobaculum rarum]|uniref:hypothetical protein n=1 Tax=Halobaculum rarum TaxID=3075122 RepID=UPI0032B0068D